MDSASGSVEVQTGNATIVSVPIPKLFVIAAAVLLVLSGAVCAGASADEVDLLLQRAAGQDAGDAEFEAVRRAAADLSEPVDRVAALRRLASIQAHSGRVEDGLMTLEQARAVVEAHPDGVGVENVRLLETEATLLQARDRNREALEVFEKALSERRRRGDRIEAARDLIGVARSLLKLGRFKECAGRAMEALRSADAVGDSAVRADAQLLLGFVNRDLQQYERALTLFRDSADSAREANDGRKLLRAINEEGNVLHYLGRPEEAIARKRAALDLAKTMEDLSGRASIENDIGFILAAEGRNEEALKAFLEAFETFQELGFPREAATTAGNAAEILSILGRPHEAMDWAQRSLELARSGDLPRVEESALRTLASIEKVLGNDARAFEFLDEAYRLGQTTHRTETARTIDDLKARFEAERRQAELEHEKTVRDMELKREQTRRRLWFAAFLGVAMVLILLANQYRLKVRAHHQVTLANDQLEAAHRRLDELARTDELTGLANRREAETRLADEVRRFERARAPFAVMMLDIDFFKRVNDVHGHDVGDRVLEHLAGILRSSTRSIDLAARWGGEEFLLVLPQTDLDGAVVVADTLRKRLAESPCSVGNRSIPVTVTIGVGLYRGGSVAACLKRADDALYLGKNEGRDRTVTEKEVEIRGDGAQV